MIWLVSQAWGLYQPTWEQLYPEAGWIQKDLISSSVGNIFIFEKTIDEMPCFQARTQTDVSPELFTRLAKFEKLRKNRMERWEMPVTGVEILRTGIPVFEIPV